MKHFDLRHGDCLAVLKTLPDNSVDSVVTDPPYGIGFMGKKWDYDVPKVEIWAECLRVLKPGGHLLCFAGTRTQHRMAVNIEDAGFEIRDMIAWVYGSGMPKSKGLLKPAVEPITLARKPAQKSSALNISACLNEDRWPANLIHDGSEEVLAAFPDAKGQQGAITGREPSAKMGAANCYGKLDLRHESTPRIEADKSAARFFYCAKASSKERHEGMQDPGPQFQHGTTLRNVENTNTKGNNHPTVKPVELMAYLCRLVTPSGGVVLDPFMGSGSTGKAAIREGFGFIGIELDEQYVSFAKARIDYEANKLPDAKSGDDKVKR